MPASKFVIKYSKLTGRVRSYAFHDGKDETDDLLPGVGIGPGEAVVLVDNSERKDLDHYQAIVTQITGLVPKGDRYATVDEKGSVTGFVIADPIGCGDSLPNRVLIAHETATVGWTLDGETLVQPK